MSDHYNVLGVRPDASPQEVEAAYRRVALERAYQDGAWRELRDAYEVLLSGDHGRIAEWRREQSRARTLH